MSTTTADADAEIDAAVDEVEATGSAAGAALVNSTTVHGEVAEHSTTPCSADEARQLIATAIAAANTFQETISTLLSRKAHVALGYTTPSEMILRELSGSVVNPRTKKPITNTHLRRMTRVAMLLWHVADNTGLDVTELSVPEYAVRSVATSEAGVGDRELVDVITQRIDELKATGPDEVSKIIIDCARDYPAAKAKAAAEAAAREAEMDSGSTGSAEESPGRPEDYVDVDDDELDGDDEAGVVGERDRPKGTNLAASAGGGPTEPAAAAEKDERPAPSDSDDSDPAPAPEAPISVTSVFDTEIPEGLDVSVSDFETSKALEHMRTAVDVRRVVNDINRIFELLPTLIEIRNRVPHIIDSFDDPELDALKAELEISDSAVEFAAQARTVIADALSEVQLRYDEAI